MRWARSVERIAEKEKFVEAFSGGNLKETLLEYMGVDGKILLKCV
jgi:hypothetical protein